MTTRMIHIILFGEVDMTNKPTILRKEKKLVLLLSATLAVGMALWSCGEANAQPPAPRVMPPLAASDHKSLVWIPVSEFVGMVLTLAVVIAIGVWLRVHQGRAAKQAADEPILDTPIEEDDEPILDTTIEEPEVPPPVTFRCPACRRGLKARADLAGKKVKCRQCGKPVLVPISRVARNGHIIK